LNDISAGLKSILQSKGYPKDNEFKLRFKESKLYGGGDRIVKTKLILESLEELHAHKEVVAFENLTIDHIMPQTLSEWWQNHLGEEWEDTHGLYLHTLGNLTLTAYNPEMSNDDFGSKKKFYKESHLELNKYFEQKEKWTKFEIEERSDLLTDKLLEIWPYFGQDNVGITNVLEVTGTTPKDLIILGQRFDVSS